MTIKALTTVAVRIIGFAMLFRAALAGVTVAVAVLRALRGATAAAGWWAAFKGGSVALVVTTFVPLVTAAICLVYTRPLVELLTRGAEDGAGEPPSRQPPPGESPSDAG